MHDKATQGERPQVCYDGGIKKEDVMGEQSVRGGHDEAVRRAFTQAILEEIKALEKMLEAGAFETGVRCMGVEQEMFLVDASCRPAPCSLKILEHLDPAFFTTELACFNMEANLEPMALEGSSFARLETRLESVIEEAREAASREGANVLLAGILPTLELLDLDLHNITPLPRYTLMNEALVALRKGEGNGGFPIFIRGLDTLDVISDTVMTEAANTSLQLHLQVDPDDFARLYNLAQLICAPQLAAGANSPVFGGRRLWQETRVALFERSVNESSVGERIRGGSPSRVSFGTRWLERSCLEIFRDDVTRFRPILVRDTDPDPVGCVERGDVPRLRALTLHNGTVWRWNRACYGISASGKPHLRIENRVLPSGPSVLDEVANAAFFYGMMLGLDSRVGEVRERLSFAHAKRNFYNAAQHGLDTPLVWLDGEHVASRELITERLLPAAEEGLRGLGVPDGDITRYLGTIEARVTTGQTGARWLLDALDGLSPGMQPQARALSATQAMMRFQQTGMPVHAWPTQQLDQASDDGGLGTVRSIMTTTLFTVRPDDVVDLASSIMDWKHVRHVPVEGSRGEAVGLITASVLFRGRAMVSDAPLAVRDIMARDPACVDPDTPLLTAMRQLVDAEVGCLLVVEEGRLIGIVSERDFLRVAAEKLERG